MIQVFERTGIRFRYPSNWTIDVEDAGDGWTATLQSPETAFVLISLRPDAENAAQVADEVLEVLRAEYPELDAETAVDSIAGQPAIGHDIDFLTLDTAILCWTRCVETPQGPLVVMGQTSEPERSQNEPVLRAVLASLQIEE